MNSRTSQESRFGFGSGIEKAGPQQMLLRADEFASQVRKPPDRAKLGLLFEKRYLSNAKANRALFRDVN